MFLYNYIYFLCEVPSDVISREGIGNVRKEGKVLMLSQRGNVDAVRKYKGITWLC